MFSSNFASSRKEYQIILLEQHEYNHQETIKKADARTKSYKIEVLLTEYFQCNYAKPSEGGTYRYLCFFESLCLFCMSK